MGLVAEAVMELSAVQQGHIVGDLEQACRHEHKHLMGVAVCLGSQLLQS